MLKILGTLFSEK